MPHSVCAPDLVPNTWQLIRRGADGKETMIAKGVFAYDLTPDGSIVYSNGNAIFVRDPGGRTQRIVMESMIEQVTVLAAGATVANPPPAT